MRQNPLILGLLMLLLALTGAAHAQGTPSGTIIFNQAAAEAREDGPNAAVIHAESNAVRTEVQAVCAPSVTPDGSALTPARVVDLLPGERATLPYQVTNAGNAPATFALSWRLDPASPLALNDAGVQLVLDANGNGVADAGETATDHLALVADEAASVLLLVRADSAARGSALVGLVASCAAGLGGASDGNNLSQLRVGEPPLLALSKRFSPEVVAPGGEVGVTLSMNNAGTGASRQAVVEDVLDTAALRGLTFVEGSAVIAAGAGQDGGSAVFENGALRWTVSSVAPGQRLSLTFRMRVAASADLGARENVATLTSGGAVQEARASLAVANTPGLALGPVADALANPGGEMSDADLQRRDFGVVGQEACFVQSVQNTGNLDDTVTLSFTLERGEAEVRLLDLNGAPLAPLALAVGQRADFRVCAVPKSAGGVRLVLAAASAQGAPVNRTADELVRVMAAVPGLVKRVAPEGGVTAGQDLTYTLEVHNPYDLPLTHVVLRDALSADLVFVSASDGGALDAGTVTWPLGALAAGETRRVRLSAKVAAGTPDGATIENRFTLQSDQTPSALTSPAVRSPVWTAGMAVEKTVAASEASVGDRVVYTLRARNLSQSGELTNVTLTDTLPRGLVYLPGSSSVNGVPVVDPRVEGSVLTWTAPQLAANTTLQVQYAARVTPEASGDLTNTVSVQGAGHNGVVVDGGVARVKIRVRPGVFAPVGDLIGLVFVDRDRDGVFDPRIDTPLPRARVILADGRMSLTDDSGRYHFAGVAEGFAALRLDPNSVPYPALPVPQDGGLPGSRGVQVRGLTSVDFPLAALSGEVAALRSTTLRMGPLTLGKALSVEGDVYTVRLSLVSAQGLPDFALSDALPEGAQLLGGQNTLDSALLGAGSTTLVYQFRFHGPAERATTDPVVRWRLP